MSALASPRRRPTIPVDVARLRKRMADAIELLIAAMDAIDGDLELEEENEHGGDVNDEPHDPDTDAEPMLGWTEHVDQEKAGERDPAVWGSFNDDMEPGLGAPENPHDQRRWAQGEPQEVSYQPARRSVVLDSLRGRQNLRPSSD